MAFLHHTGAFNIDATDFNLETLTLTYRMIHGTKLLREFVDSLVIPFRKNYSGKDVQYK